MPNEGPRLGSRKQTTDCFPILFKPSFSPTEVVVFPSPAGVGVIAVTNIKLLFYSFRELMYSKFNFAMCRPIGLKLKGSSEIFDFFKTSLIGLIFAALAISISDLILLI